jgi:hypothetical protein
MQNYLYNFLDLLRDKKQFLSDSARSKAVDVLEWETSELENIFSLLIFGSFVGLPATPSSITLSLLPYMEKELELMIEKVEIAAGPISDLFSHLDTP